MHFSATDSDGYRLMFTDDDGSDSPAIVIRGDGGTEVAFYPSPAVASDLARELTEWSRS